jgi:hypothetical protein
MDSVARLQHLYLSKVRMRYYPTESILGNHHHRLLIRENP